MSQIHHVLVPYLIAASVNLTSESQGRTVHPLLERQRLLPAPGLWNIFFPDTELLECIRDTVLVTLVPEPPPATVKPDGGEAGGILTVDQHRSKGDESVVLHKQFFDVQVDRNIQIATFEGKTYPERIGHIFLEFLRACSGSEEKADCGENIFSHIGFLLLEYIDNVESGFCQADIVIVAVFKQGTAFLAFVDIIVDVGISDSPLELKIPVLAEDECVAVGKAGSRKPSLIASLVEIVEDLVDQRDICEDTGTGHIEETAVGMYTDEMAGEPVAEPVASFRLYEGMLAEQAVVEFPRHVVSADVQCPSRCQTDFETEIGRSGCSIGKICFQGYVLGSRFSMKQEEKAQDRNDIQSWR